MTWNDCKWFCRICGRQGYAKGLCPMHYQRQREGRPIDGAFWVHGESSEEKVKRIMDQATWKDDCLIAARIGRNGYATSIKDDDGKGIKTHRLVYRVTRGPIPNDVDIHHVCANRACINPEHLQLATRRENTIEMRSRKSLLAHIANLEAEIARLKGEAQ